MTTLIPRLVAARCSRCAAALRSRPHRANARGRARSRQARRHSIDVRAVLARRMLGRQRSTSATSASSGCRCAAACCSASARRCSQDKTAGLRVPAHRVARRRRLLRGVALGQKEAAFKLVSAVGDDRRQGDASSRSRIPQHDFPQRIIYRRGTEGWLYATIEGKIKGEDARSSIRMRRIDCESGEFIRK